MKLAFRFIVVSVLAIWLLPWILFNVMLGPAQMEQPIISQSTFIQQREAFVGQQWKFQGLVTKNYYLPGIGCYKLTDSKGYSIYILCNRYPPASGQLLEVTVYISPLIKLDNPLTLQLEVKVPEVLLPSPNSSKTLSYDN